MSDVFEKNIAALVKRSALPPDDGRRTRSREEFLRAVRPAPSRGRQVAVAAAVLLFCGVVYETTTRPLSKLPPAPESPSIGKQSEPPWTDVPGEGGNDLIHGSLRLARKKGPTGTQALEFRGRTTLPEEFVLRARIMIMEEQLRGGTLTSQPKPQGAANLEVEKGSFLLEQVLHVPALLRIGIDAPSDLQDRTVLELTKTKEADRVCSFQYSVWNQALLTRLEPQLAELADIAREARELVARVQVACATEETFREREKPLTAEASKLQARALGLAANNLYPAAAYALGYTMRDLANALGIFKWKDGKFEGPVSYYTNGKPGRLHRGDEFSFDALRRYLDLAVLISGREFDLWILREFSRAGSTPELALAVSLSEERPGIKEFAPELKALSDVKAPLPPTLEERIRQVSK